MLMQSDLPHTMKVEGTGNRKRKKNNPHDRAFELQRIADEKAKERWRAKGLPVED